MQYCLSMVFLLFWFFLVKIFVVWLLEIFFIMLFLIITYWLFYWYYYPSNTMLLQAICALCWASSVFNWKCDAIYLILWFKDREIPNIKFTILFVFSFEWIRCKSWILSPRIWLKFLFIIKIRKLWSLIINCSYEIYFIMKITRVRVLIWRRSKMKPWNIRIIGIWKVANATAAQW